MMLRESNGNFPFYPTRAKRTLRLHNINSFYRWKYTDFKGLNVLTQWHKSKWQWRPAASVYDSVVSVYAPLWSTQWTHACTYAYFLYIWDIKSPWVIPQIILKFRKQDNFKFNLFFRAQQQQQKPVSSFYSHINSMQLPSSNLAWLLAEIKFII